MVDLLCKRLTKLTGRQRKRKYHKEKRGAPQGKRGSTTRRIGEYHKENGGAPQG